MDDAARELARATGVLFRLILEGIVAYLLAKGAAQATARVAQLVERLKASRLGAGFARWVEVNREKPSPTPPVNRNITFARKQSYGRRTLWFECVIYLSRPSWWKIGLATTDTEYTKKDTRVYETSRLYSFFLADVYTLKPEARAAFFVWTEHNTTRS